MIAMPTATAAAGGQKATLDNVLAYPEQRHAAAGGAMKIFQTARDNLPGVGSLMKAEQDDTPEKS